jgi:uncharacterized protein (TIGR03546 family)
VNLSVGMLSALMISFIAGYLDPVAHRCGLLLLRAAPLQSVWTLLYNTPLVPWTHFNNTVVLGNFGFGLLLFYPTYRLTLPLFEKRQRAPSRSANDDDPQTMVLAWRKQQCARLLAEVEGLSRNRRAA